METKTAFDIDKNWTDINALSGIPIGQQMLLHNAGRAGDLIEVAVSELEPTVDFRGVPIKSLEPQFRVSPQVFPVWVRHIRYDISGSVIPTAQRKCLLSVQEIADIEEVGGIPSAAFTSNDDEMRIKVKTDNDLTAFGELKTESMSAITQISAQYGLLTNVLTVLDDNASGSNSVVDSKFTCETGTAADGLASILTFRQLAYRAGQGALARFTALFDTPVVDSIQAAGLITAENSFVFAYVGTNFGIVHASDGMDELQELTLTVVGGLEIATVTINGTAYPVNLTGSGTISGDAFDISVSLNAQVPNYDFTSNGAQVVAQAVIPAISGAFAYSSAGTSVGAWVQLSVGAPANQSFIPQSLWNRDSFPDLNHQMGNVYQIQFQYLGFGAINFYVESGQSGELVLAHQIEYGNQNTTPSVSNPTFRIGWLANNSGNTSSIKVQGSSAAAFVEGGIFRDSAPRAEANEQLSVTTALTNIISIRNRISFGGGVNRAEIFPQLVTASSQTNKAAFFSIIINPVFSSPVDFSYEDKENSLAEFTKDNSLITGGQVIGTLTVVNGSSQLLRFNDSQITAIQPGTVICIAAQMSSGASADCQASASWQEDL